MNIIEINSDVRAANDAADPYESIESAIDWLRLLRREALARWAVSTSPERRRRLREAIADADATVATLSSRL